MELHSLPKIITHTPKRIGSGWGSGKGKYSGRGRKGQHARASVRLLFEGGQMVLQKGLPMLRGKLKNNSFRKDVVVVNCDSLEKNALIVNGSVVDKALLVKAHLLKEKEVKTHEVKILGRGVLTKKLTIKISASKTALEKIKKAGGEYLS